MKTKTEPALTLPRLSIKLDKIAGDLARSALEFGVVLNDSFPQRLATIGFANGVLLALHDAKGATALEELLVGESIPLPEELQGLTSQMVKKLGATNSQEFAGRSGGCAQAVASVDSPR